MADPHFTLEAIAARCGFDDPHHFRRLWQTRHGTPSSTARTAGHGPRPS